MRLCDAPRRAAGAAKKRLAKQGVLAYHSYTNDLLRTPPAVGGMLSLMRKRRPNEAIMTAAHALLAAASSSDAASPAARPTTIKIGEINSYSALPSFTEPYRKGWQLAVEEINAKGGIDGKKLVVISKDDAGKPADAMTAANELVSNDGVAMLAGGFFSNVGLAVADFAKQKKVLFSRASR